MDEENELYLIRKPFGVSQDFFAGMMGVPLRTYEALERGINPVRTVHIRAAEAAALQLATDRMNPTALPAKLILMLQNLYPSMRAEHLIEDVK